MTCRRTSRKLAAIGLRAFQWNFATSTSLNGLNKLDERSNQRKTSDNAGVLRLRHPRTIWQQTRFPYWYIWWPRTRLRLAKSWRDAFSLPNNWGKEQHPQQNETRPINSKRCRWSCLAVVTEMGCQTTDETSRPATSSEQCGWTFQELRYPGRRSSHPHIKMWRTAAKLTCKVDHI